MKTLLGEVLIFVKNTPEEIEWLKNEKLSHILVIKDEMAFDLLSYTFIELDSESENFLRRRFEENFVIGIYDKNFLNEQQINSKKLEKFY